MAKAVSMSDRQRWGSATTRRARTDNVSSLLRLRSRAAKDLARDAEKARGPGDIRLHSTARQRRCANPRREGDA
jgi:hypothetical protein